MNKIYTKARAKVNLTLEILDKREDRLSQFKVSISKNKFI